MTKPTIERCPWRGIEDAGYAHYHDTEWGVPLRDDRALFEKLTLEGFQSGLSWLTILRKRENFRHAFDNFDATKIARYRTRDIERLMADAGIVRNRAKIEATIDNAKAFLTITQETSFTDFIWAHRDSAPTATVWQRMADMPAQTPASKRLSSALKAKGFRFVGPTTAYSFMQSSGMVNDHLVTCHRHAACEKLQRKIRVAAR